MGSDIIAETIKDCNIACKEEFEHGYISNRDPTKKCIEAIGDMGWNKRSYGSHGLDAKCATVVLVGTYTQKIIDF